MNCPEGFKVVKVTQPAVIVAFLRTAFMLFGMAVLAEAAYLLVVYGDVR